MAVPQRSPRNRVRSLRTLLAPVLLAPVLLMLLVTHSFAQTLPVPSTIDDFFQPGTQPQTITATVMAGTACTLCHGYFSQSNSPYDRWATTIMAQASRDPLFHACLAIAEQDSQASGDLCLRCHTPSAWLAGRSQPTSGSALTGINDWDGITCNFCHRMVDPFYAPGQSPSADSAILAALPDPPAEFHSGQYVIDPQDRRRGPFNLVSMSFHAWFQSPFHRESALCGTCHDVSNPMFVRIGDSYVPDTLGQPHPTHSKLDEFPLERTYSEWLQSSFAMGPIDMGGRFGGNQPAVSTCQDCHMPKTTASACSLGGVVRPDQPLHDFAGAQTWVLDAIQNLDTTYQIWDTPAYMDPVQLEASKSRNTQMLEAASDIELTKVGAQLQVRVVNQSGHKLPSGYPEGRRIWVNVRYRDAGGVTIAEHGHYDFATGVLTAGDTKVYQAKLGLDATMAALTGLPEGESFHFALNNDWIFDNRIPPRGFTNAGFASVQAEPIGYVYPDGQYWDDTLYPIPPGADTAEVRVYYQTASKEYIEFLYTENVTNNRGQILYDQWLLSGKGPPVVMDVQTIDVSAADLTRGNCNSDGAFDVADPITLLTYLFAAGPGSTCESACDGNDDGQLNIADAVYLLAHLFTQGAPPPSPHPTCGADPTLDALTCITSPCP